MGPVLEGGGAQRVVLSSYSPNTGYNTHYLAIRREHKDKYFTNVDGHSFVVALRRLGTGAKRGPGGPWVCVNVTVLDCDPEGDDTASGLSNEVADEPSMFCPEQLLARFGLRRHERCVVMPIRPPPLTKVTLAADDDDVFTWTTSHAFSTGLLVSVCNQHAVIVRKGDTFIIPHSELFNQNPDFDESYLTRLRVLDTEPFCQGAVTVNTELLILNTTTTKASEPDPGGDARPVPEPSKAAAVRVSDFSVPLTSVFIPRHVNKPVLYKTLSNQVCLQRDWNVLPCCYLHVLKEDAPLSSATDHTLYAMLNTLKQFSLFNNSLIEIKLETRCPLSEPQTNSVAITENKVTPKNTRTKPSTVRRIVHIKAIQPKQKMTDNNRCQDASVENKFFIPCSLLFNLCRGQNKNPTKELLIRFRKYQPEAGYQTSTSTSWSGHLPYAREVYISCVYSPQYSTGTPYSTVLQKYFSTPRTLQKDDVLAVDTSIDLEFHQRSEDGCDTYPIVYFKVKRITPRTKQKHQTYLVDSEHCALYQDGPCHSYIPSSIEQALNNRDHPVTLPGLDHHVTQLIDTLQPYLEKWCQSTESLPAVLIHGPSGCGKTSICKAVAMACCMHYFRVNCHDLCGETSSATETRILQSFTRACLHSPCIFHLCNIHALGKDRDGNNDDARVASYFHECIKKILHKESPDWPVIVIATTTKMKALTPDMHAGFLHTFEIEVPSASSRKLMLQALLRDTPHVSSLCLDKITQRTAGFVLGDLVVLVAEARKKAYEKLLSLCFPGVTSPSPEDEYSLSVCGPMLQQVDFDRALDSMQAAHSDAIGAPKIPNVTWDDVGGLSAVKADILDTLQLPLQHPELFAAGLHRSGVLLFGPPGTGKTLLAKAVATECSLNFLSVKGPELINMYVGQSEENIREVFSRARNAAPCVIFFDELDSLAPNRGRSGDSGGVMDRVVSQLLAELDGLHKSTDVFVIGATNRPDLLDPALLRPGRFDKLLYLGVSEDKATQLKIIKALTRKFNLAPSCNLEEIVEKCPNHMTGADFYALCSDAMLNALKRKIDQLEAGIEISEDKMEVSASDFYEALKSLVPSVSEAELERYRQLRQTLSEQK